MSSFSKYAYGTAVSKVSHVCIAMPAKMKVEATFVDRIDVTLTPGSIQLIQGSLTEGQRQYISTLLSLFSMLAKANVSDSDDSEQREAWQVATDASGRGYFGFIEKAIVEIAGNEIMDNWLDCSEVQLTLASRLQAGPIALAPIKGSLATGEGLEKTVDGWKWRNAEGELSDLED